MTAKNIFIILPENAEFEPGFRDWIQKAFKLCKELGGKIQIHANKKTIETIQKLIEAKKWSVDPKWEKAVDWEDFPLFSKDLTKDDLLVSLLARKGSLSYAKEMNEIPRILSKYFADLNFFAVYPSTQVETDSEGYSAYDSFLTPIQESIDRIRKTGKLISRILRS